MYVYVFAGGGYGQVSAIALARVGKQPSLLDHDSSSCNGCDNGHRDSQGRCALVCGSEEWIYIGVFAPLSERQLTPAPPNATAVAGVGFKGERVNGAGVDVRVAAAKEAPASHTVPFKFIVTADGHRFAQAYVFDLPHCGFAQVSLPFSFFSAHTTQGANEELV